MQRIVTFFKLDGVDENGDDNSSSADNQSPKYGNGKSNNTKGHRKDSSTSSRSSDSLNGKSTNNNNNNTPIRPNINNNNNNNTPIRPKPNIITNYKICIGDKVKVTTSNFKLRDEKGTVMYIGYPYPGKGVRYGINLSSAKGDFDGTKIFNLKTGKIAKSTHLKKYKKQIKKRKFFKAKKNHAIFVKLEEISGIDRESTLSTRFTIEDKVEVRFRGVGRIKFIGNLEHTKEMGIWYGIQLKDRRGRHDGTVNGVKYFECAPQYGLHCRQNHLKIVEDPNITQYSKNDNKNNTKIVFSSKDDGDEGSSTQYIDLPNNRLPRVSITDKPQKSDKWAKLMGVPSSSIKGFNPPKPNKYTSAVNLTAPRHFKKDSSSISSSKTSAEEPKPFRLVSTDYSKTKPSNIGIPSSRNLQTMASLSNILPPNVFHNNISVHVLPGLHPKASNSHKRSSSQSYSKSQQPSVQPESKHDSIKRGGTMVVLPGYHERFKQKKFFDFFDFDEIEDELGEGEFGVVYKCRRVVVEDDDDDDYNEYSTTIKTMKSNMSMTGTLHYPGDDNSDIEDSANYPGDSSDGGSFSSDNDDDDEEIFAVKKIKKAKFHHLNHTHKAENIKLLQQEIRLLEKMQHLKARNMDGSNYVIDLIDVFEDRNYLYIVTNFCAGGNLWTHIEHAAAGDTMIDDDDDDDDNFSDDGIDKNKIDNEQTIQKIMKQILEGLSFLHRNNVAHLDIKPDNIMFTQKGDIQLIDFGMSRMIPPLHKAGVLVGTPNFVAPEVIEGFYDKKADVWSVGVIFFMLRFGYPPFFDGNSNVNAQNKSINNVNDDDNKTDNLAEHKSLFEQIKKGFEPIVKEGLGPWFPSDVPVSDNLKDLISKMLERDLAKRYTAAECLTHPYFKELADNKKLAPVIMDALTKFSGQCHFKVMISRLFAHQIEPEQLKLLQDCWDKFDTDNDGSLTLSQFRRVMNEYDHGYKDYQIDAMFEALDWNETDTINFNSLLTAFSYQRLVAVDERLWEAFARLDVDNDGHITKAEIKRVLAMVNPKGFTDGVEKLNLFQPENGSGNKNLDIDVTKSKRHLKTVSVFIGECMISADWDDDGQIDYEEFLRALHPRFNEDPVTPKALTTPSKEMAPKEFIFQPSLGMGMHLSANNKNNNNNNQETNKSGYDKFKNMKGGNRDESEFEITSTKSEDNLVDKSLNLPKEPLKLQEVYSEQ